MEIMLYFLKNQNISDLINRHLYSKYRFMSLYREKNFIHVGCMLAGKLSISLHGQRSSGWGEEPKKPVIPFTSVVEKEKKKPFCCRIYSARLLLSIRSCKFMAVGTKSFFFPFPCYRYRKVRLVSEL